jgi:hypothetical protein
VAQGGYFQTIIELSFIKGNDCSSVNFHAKLGFNSDVFEYQRFLTV